MNYFDYAATTPIAQDVLTAYNQVAKEYWGNTNSLHDIGSKAAGLLEHCRKELAGHFHVQEKGIHFTSGGTEGNHISILSLAMSLRHKGNHIITSMAEHSSVHAVLEFLTTIGFNITKIPYTSNGHIDIQALEKAIDDETVLITIGHTNGEIGSIQPLEQIRKLIGSRSIFLHSDFVQSFGKVDLKKEANLVDSFTISSHKVYGPKGVGAIYMNPTLDIKPYMPLQTHENGFRGGTINVPGIAGFLVASERIDLQGKSQHYSQLRSLFLNTLRSDHFVTVEVIEGEHQMPQVVGLCFEGIQGQWLMLECNRLGYAISTGTACQVGKQAPSKTIEAMGLSQQKALEFIRISFGEDTTEQDVKSLAEALFGIVREFTRK